MSFAALQNFEKNCPPIWTKNVGKPPNNAEMMTKKISGKRLRTSRSQTDEEDQHAASNCGCNALHRIDENAVKIDKVFGNL